MMVWRQQLVPRILTLPAIKIIGEFKKLKKKFGNGPMNPFVGTPLLILKFLKKNLPISIFFLQKVSFYENSVAI